MATARTNKFAKGWDGLRGDSNEGGGPDTYYLGFWSNMGPFYKVR